MPESVAVGAAISNQTKSLAIIMRLLVIKLNQRIAWINHVELDHRRFYTLEYRCVKTEIRKSEIVEFYACKVQLIMQQVPSYEGIVASQVWVKSLIVGILGEGNWQTQMNTWKPQLCVIHTPLAGSFHFRNTCKSGFVKTRITCLI